MKHSPLITAPWALLAPLAALVLGFTLNLAAPWGLPEARAQAEALRPEVGKPLQEAQALIKARRYNEALNKVRDADNVANKTAYETFVLEQMRSIAAASAGDTETAVRAFDAMTATGRLSGAGQLPFIDAIARGYYSAKNYAKAVAWAERYFKAGGNSSSTRTLLIQSQYLAGDCSGAVRALNAEINANEQAGQAPSEDRLSLLANCYLKLNDKAGYTRVLERLVMHYPKREYWADLISRTQKKPGVSDRYALDFYRLLFATGNVHETSDYMEMSQLALQAGFPTEARKVVEEGYDKKVLGTGAEAERHKRLRDMANKQAAEDQKLLAKPDGGAKDGEGLVNAGYAFVTMGEAQKGIALMEQGIARDALKHPEDAKLHLGMAYLAAGDKAKSIKTLKSVQGTEGAADVARLWILYANKN